MTEDKANNGNVSQALLCLGCGQPLRGNDHFCRQCAERGLGPCETCEGAPLDLEEEAS